MGKSLVIKGADFSTCGFKEVNYKTYITPNASASNVKNTYFRLADGMGKTLSDFKMEIKYVLTANRNTMGFLFSAVYSDTNRASISKTYNSSLTAASEIVYQYGQGLNVGYKETVAAEDIATPTEYHVLFNGDGTVTINGTSHTISDNKTNVIDYLCLFNYRGDADRARGDIFKLKEFIVKEEDDTVLYDYVPALDDSDVPCIYDKISKTYLYPVAGTVICSDSL